MPDRQPAFGPSANWENLKRRAALLGNLRDFFAHRGFLEVETPLLSHDTVVDRHLDPLSVRLFDDPRDPDRGDTLWLQTSPEFAMKRLLAAGATAIYQVTRAFRGGESGPLHNPEFTMVEWYRVGDDLQGGIALLDELSQAMLGRGPAEVISYRAAFERAVGLDPHRCSLDELKTSAFQRGCVPTDSWDASDRDASDRDASDRDASDRDAWLDWLLVSNVEPILGFEQPAILFDYPASQAALAQIRNTPEPVAERFELYVDGIELANGYHELLDADVLAERTERSNRLRVADGKQPLPADNRLVDAMRSGLPPCAGVALGFDRLVMVAVGAQSLHEVMAFPIDRA